MFHVGMSSALVVASEISNREGAFSPFLVRFSTIGGSDHGKHRS